MNKSEVFGPQLAAFEEVPYFRMAGFRKALAEYSPNVRRPPSCLQEGERRTSSVFVLPVERRSPNIRRMFVVRLPDSPEGARFDRTTRKALAEYSASADRKSVV